MASTAVETYGTNRSKPSLPRPIAGSGFDAHRAAIEISKEAHNTPISILVETGLIGFALSGRVVMEVLLRAWQRTGWAFAFWMTQLAVIAIGSMSLSIEDHKSVWFMFALCVVSAAAVPTSRSFAAPSANVRESA